MRFSKLPRSRDHPGLRYLVFLPWSTILGVLAAVKEIIGTYLNEEDYLDRTSWEGTFLAHSCPSPTCQTRAALAVEISSCSHFNF